MKRLAAPERPGLEPRRAVRRDRVRRAGVAVASTELRVSVRVAWWVRALPLAAWAAGVVVRVLPERAARWFMGLFLRVFFAALRRGVRRQVFDVCSPKPCHADVLLEIANKDE